jgi:hypothetical protein
VRIGKQWLNVKAENPTYTKSSGEPISECQNHWCRPNQFREKRQNRHGTSVEKLRKTQMLAEVKQAGYNSAKDL